MTVVSKEGISIKSISYPVVEAGMEQTELERMVHEVLGDAYKDYAVSQYRLVEDMRENCARVECVLIDSQSGDTREIEGLGVGLVDALFTTRIHRCSAASTLRARMSVALTSEI